MKKKVLLTTAGVSLLSLGLTTANLNHDVHAAKVTAGKTAKLTHTAYVYNSKGKHIKKATLKKNKTTKVIKIVKIKGKNYAQIGKNQFVKLGNLSSASNNKKVHKAKKSKDKYKKIWDKKLKGIEDADGYKVTALKDTTIDYDMDYDWYTTGHAKGKINFPKGSSIYITDFQKEKQMLMVTIDDEGGNEGISININDVSLSKWNPPYSDSDDQTGGWNLDTVIPQVGPYKRQKYQGINGGEYSLLGTERELTRRGVFKKITYSTNVQKVIHESDADYKNDLDKVQAYYESN